MRTKTMLLFLHYFRVTCQIETRISLYNSIIIYTKTARLYYIFAISTDTTIQTTKRYTHFITRQISFQIYNSFAYKFVRNIENKLLKKL